MRIDCEAIMGKDLKPGDLFSTGGPEYWETIDTNMSIGEKCYIRTNTEPGLASDADTMVWRLTIQHGECPHCGENEWGDVAEEWGGHQPGTEQCQHCNHVRPAE